MQVQHEFPHVALSGRYVFQAQSFILLQEQRTVLYLGDFSTPDETFRSHLRLNSETRAENSDLEVHLDFREKVQPLQVLLDKFCDSLNVREIVGDLRLQRGVAQLTNPGVQSATLRYGRESESIALVLRLFQFPDFQLSGHLRATACDSEVELAETAGHLSLAHISLGCQLAGFPNYTRL